MRFGSAKLIYIVLVTVVMAAVVLLLLLPVDRYDWMQQMDPSVRPGDIQDASQDRRLVAGLIAMVGVAAAALIAITARKATRRVLGIGGVIGVATVWFVKFAG